MSLHNAGVLAGTVSTVLFMIGYLPMLIRAARTRDLSSYSPSSLIITNLGNLVHSLYVFSLPAGPLWILHSFYLISSAVMLWWWARHHGPGALSRRQVFTRQQPSDEAHVDPPRNPRHDLPTRKVDSLTKRGFMKPSETS